MKATRSLSMLRLLTLLSLCFALLLQVGVLAVVVDNRNGVSSEEQQQQHHRFHREDHNSGGQSMVASSQSEAEEIVVPESSKGKAQATTSTSDTRNDGFAADEAQPQNANANANAADIAEPSRRILQDALRQVVDHVLDDHPSSAEYHQHEIHVEVRSIVDDDSNTDQAVPVDVNNRQQPEARQEEEHQHAENLSSWDIRVAIADIDVDKLSEANAVQIRQLLQSLADSNRLSTRPHSQQSSSSFDEDDYDDRTLLDIFGETAKHYLTQEMIPDTDVECRWDWRSIRCEPACQCHLDMQFGDYHLGRSCRFRQAAEHGGGGIDPHCVDVHPAVFLRELPVTRRIISLSTQTFDILKAKSKQAARISRREFNTQYSRLQERVCRNLWDLQAKQLQDPLFCLPERQVPTRRSMAEKVLCGPQVDFNVCEDRMQDFMARKKKKKVVFADRR